MYLSEAEWDNVDCIHLTEHRLLVSSCEHGNEPSVP